MPSASSALPFVPDPARPVLLAGPTASGKSAIALDLAERQGRAVINADALQVFDCWHILTARPGPDELARAEHKLYGHVAWHEDYSVGRWLAEVRGLLARTTNPVIVGGTGLYFTALTRGLAEIPAVPAEVRAAAEARLEERGLAALVAELDRRSRDAIDTANPARVLRAWEVLQATGRGIRSWQDATAPPLLPREAATTLVIDAETEWLSGRIERRFDAMLAHGGLEEARAALEWWEPGRPAARAIGAAELIGHLRGETSLEAAVAAAKQATRRYAKRQRTWLRNRMPDWQRVRLP